MQIHKNEFTFLPSRFYPYEFDSLTMSLFGGKELPLLSKAAHNNTLLPLVEAISQVSEIDAKELTVGDFYYLLAWQRLQAYSSNKMVAVWQCDGELFVNEETKEVYTPRQLTELPASMSETPVYSTDCGHINHSDIGFTDVNTLILPEGVDLDDRLDFPKAGLLDEVNSCIKDEDLRYIVPAATWIKEGSTIKDKIDILLAEPDMQLFDLAGKYNSTVIHGISTNIVKACANCGKKAKSKFSLAPDSFFWT